MVKSHILSGFLKFSLFALLISVLTGCPNYIPHQANFDETKNSRYYLAQSENSSGSEKINWQLFAIRALLSEGNLTQAKQLLDQIPKSLNNEQEKEKILLQGEVAVRSKQKFDINSLSLANLNEDQKIRYYKIKIELDGQKQDNNAKIHDLIELEKYGSVEQRHDAINLTWQFLSNLSEKQINKILVYANEYVLQGWIDLSYLYNSNLKTYAINEQDDADTIARLEEDKYKALKNAISEWQIQYSSHPAANYLPRDIYGSKHRLSDPSEYKKVALLLPLSGQSKIFGETIRLGYQDAAKVSSENQQQDVIYFDTNSDSIDNLVIRAKQQGAQLIVGPLLKQNVQTLLQSSPDLPVLALNKIEDINSLPSHANKICFFALSPEDEAKDAAKHIYSENKKQPLLIIPHNNLGERVAKSFSQQWDITNPNSKGIYVQYFNSAQELSKKMNSGIGIELEGIPLTHSNTESTIQNNSVEQPKFDAIYIYASHEELTLIKSMLEMKSNKVIANADGNNNKNENKQSEIKVIPMLYASSRSNIANTTTDFRYDMDKLQLSDIPLIVKQKERYSQLPDYIKNDFSLVRLYAMGFDAWTLSNHFDTLIPYQTGIINGETGRLSVTEQCDITRTLSWIRYKNGNEVAIN